MVSNIFDFHPENPFGRSFLFQIGLIQPPTRLCLNNPWWLCGWFFLGVGNRIEDSQPVSRRRSDQRSDKARSCWNGISPNEGHWNTCRTEVAKLPVGWGGNHHEKVWWSCLSNQEWCVCFFLFVIWVGSNFALKTSGCLWKFVLLWLLGGRLYLFSVTHVRRRRNQIPWWYLVLRRSRLLVRWHWNLNLGRPVPKGRCVFFVTVTHCKMHRKETRQHEWIHLAPWHDKKTQVEHYH